VTRLAALVLAALLWSPGARADGGFIEVDVQLVLAIDISFSISTDEQDIQRQGYVAAFRDPEVIRAITSGLRGRISVTVLEWAGEDSQAQTLPWTLIADAEGAHAFADALDAAPVRRSGRTSISQALEAGLSLMRASPFAAERHVIDLSSDGMNNDGRRVDRLRDLAVYHGITINGLPILVGAGTATTTPLDAYFRDCVIGGPGAFVAPVVHWRDFAGTLKRKLVLEIAGRAPEAMLIRASDSPADCLAGEKADLKDYIDQLERATGGNADRWRPREQDWPMPD